MAGGEGVGMEYKELKLTDLIDKEILQKVQDGFSDMSGMAAITTETNGRPVTTGSHFSDFCMKYTRGSALGCARCEQCDSQRWSAVNLSFISAMRDLWILQRQSWRTIKW